MSEPEAGSDGAACSHLPAPAHPRLQWQESCCGPPVPAGPGRSEVMEVAPLSPCSGCRPEPRPGLRGGRCHGMREAQILEDQGLRPNTEVDTSYPPRSGQDPSLKGRVDLMGSMEMWTLRNAWCKPERGGARPGRQPPCRLLAQWQGRSEEGGRSAGPGDRGRRPKVCYEKPPKTLGCSRCLWGHLLGPR